MKLTTSEAVLDAPVLEQEPVLTPDQLIDQQIQKIMGTGQGRVNVNEQITMQEARIYDQHVDVEVGGLWKTISLIDFKKILDSQLQLESQMTFMALPYNCYMFAKSASEIKIGCYYPERKMDLTFQSYRDEPKVYKNCLLPNIVISHILILDGNEWRIRDSKFFCTSKRVTELPEDQLLWDQGDGVWLMPFPNFYEDGRMCYGQNTMPLKHKNNLRGLDYFYQVIGLSPFNSDLGLKVSSYRDNIPSWFKYLTTIDKFDYTLLSNRGY